MKLGVILPLLGFLVACGESTLPQMINVHSKFQYKYSFKGPHMLDPKGNIPFWTHGGSAIASDDYLRVCPSVRSHRGWAWTKNSLTSNHWFIDVSLRVTGRLKTGADGMAIWVAAQAGGEGPVYGSSDRWKGVGLFLDSFDNDAQGDNPKIQVVLNDGTIAYDHRSDGSQQQSSSCLKDFRNRPYPVKIRMTFIRDVLEVWVHDGVSVVEDDYELCLRVESDGRLRSIPKEMYFGVSAATGGLSDDHDILSFMTYSVQTFEEKATKQIMANDTAFLEAQDKYQQMSGEFDQRREKYLKDHPDMASRMEERMGQRDMDWQKRMDLEQSVQVVADMMVAIQREIKGLTRKVDILMTQGSQGAREGGGGRDNAVTPNALAGELSQIRSTESNILNQLADLKAALDRKMPSSGTTASTDQLQPLTEVKNLVRQQSSQLESFTAHLQELSQKQCPSAAPTGDNNVSCLSPWLFIVVIVLQMALFIGYTLYTQAQEMRAKKFF